MFYKSNRHFDGLDHSGPCMVLPPTFGGIRQLVERVGESAAKLAYPVTPPVDDASHDLVRDFLQDLTYADKVERQTLIREFSTMVKDLSDSASTPPPAAAAAEPAAGAPAAAAPAASEPAPAGSGAES